MSDGDGAEKVLVSSVVIVSDIVLVSVSELVSVDRVPENVLHSSVEPVTVVSCGVDCGPVCELVWSDAVVLSTGSSPSKKMEEKSTQMFTQSTKWRMRPWKID